LADHNITVSVIIRSVKIIPKTLFAVLFLALLAAFPSAPVSAAGSSASDLISAVNAFRVENGLAPYGVDSALMSEAQAQSDYQASIQTSTHQRADGSGPGNHGVAAENVASGTNLSADAAVRSIWTDSVHMSTMLGPTTGLVGAGAATSGDTVYYTLDVKNTSGNFTYRPPSQATALPGQPTFTPNVQPPAAGPVITSTPNSDGSIKHVIQPGEFLVDIVKAYGITLDQLYTLNHNIDPKKPVYNAGQVLIIRPAPTATITPSPTLSPIPPTHTLRPTRTPTKVIIPTQTPTPTATPVPSLVDKVKAGLSRTRIAYALIALCGIGLAVVVVKGFITVDK
jgi:LysM repeat protein